MAAVRAFNSSHLFGDATYHSIRFDLIPELFQLSQNTEQDSFASILENWACLCNLFQQRPTQRLHEGIVAWNPEHAETQRVKAIWMQASEALQHSEVDKREHVITNLFIFLAYVSHHIKAERQLLSPEESDSKQNDSEPSASSVEDQPPSASAVIFDDRPYASIRRHFFELPLKVELQTPVALESWPALYSLFKKLHLAPLSKLIDAWNPEHEETQKVKVLWLEVRTALQDPEVDQREHLVTTFLILISLMAEHDLLEEASRASSPVSIGPAAPPSSPEGSDNKTPVVNDETT